MAGRSDKVEESVDTVVAEARVTLDTALLGENVIVLALEVADNLGEADEAQGRSARSTLEARRRGERDLRELVVNLVSEAGGVNDGERDANALLLELCYTIG